ncbi:hypothetical protein Taro_026471, partial [Colocasia esculenta]|nr:hypothetical protein [Colocasia esculenta]
EGNEASFLVFTDLYYHILGELEGRVIAAGHFKEVLQYLLELDIFQNYECKCDRDLWPPENDINMFDVARLRTDLGIELWDYSDWKTSKSVAERMLSVMHHTNSVKFLAISKNSALSALTCLLSIQSRNIFTCIHCPVQWPLYRSFHSIYIYSSKNQCLSCHPPPSPLASVHINQSSLFFHLQLDETQPIPFGERISEPLLQSSIEHLCQCLQTAKASLLPAMIPSDDSLKFLATQVELLLNLSKLLLISYRHNTNASQLFPLSLLLIRTSDMALRLLSDVRQSPVSQRVVKFFLTLLLTSMEIIYPISVDNLASEVEQFAETSLLKLGLLPVLCKYTETSEHSNLSVAAIDFILKGFSTPTTWLPVLQNHLHLQLIILKVQQQCGLCSVPIFFKFLLTLARTKGGAEMLSRANIFQSLKVLLTLFLKGEPYSSDTEGFSICNTVNEDEDLKRIWGLGLAISASMICSVGDDIACAELVGNVIQYFFSEKASRMFYHLSFPKLPSDDHSKKKPRVQESQTSLTALKETEYALMLTCMLAKHQNVWIKEIKEMDTELRETIIHMLAFISKGTQRVGDSPSQTPPLLCPPLLKKEIAAQRRPAFVESKHGWFNLAALGSAPQNKLSALSSTYLPERTEKQANGNANFQRTHFSDTVATQIYKIAFLLLKFLCTQARLASKRAEEVEYVDLAHFPELPMPEILHGIEDQSITIVTEICQANRAREIHPESQAVCLLLLQILEKSLYLELCVSQSCGVRPVLGRVEDFSKEIKMLMEGSNLSIVMISLFVASMFDNPFFFLAAVDKYPPLKTSVKSLQQIIVLRPRLSLPPVPLIQEKVAASRFVASGPGPAPAIRE